jgi:hypothetical protein
MTKFETFQVAKVNRVSIIIEDDEGNSTWIRVPQAKNLEVISEPIPVGSEENGQFFTDQVKLKLELTAIFDQERDHLYSIETSGVGVPVE